MRKKSNKILVYGTIIIVLVLLVFFVAGGSFGGGKSGGTPGVAQAWMEIELKDVNSGETFKISDFEGQKVLIESFAVWCPTCTLQQQKTKEFEQTSAGKDVISISLDLDPGEDEAQVLRHTEENGFDWRYAISPIELTQGLIDDFGSSVISAPSVPMILICEDLSFRKLGGFGVRSVEKLQAEIAQGCGG